jgi:2-(1,2-epoxy-1,2-dihydrophenyl)acetyl-CoA isomerase
VRIASTSATFIGGWARLGFSGDFGGAWLLRHRVGPSKALEILATNRTVTAVEALEIGMVDHLVEEKLFADACWDMARSFADGPRSAISFMKQNILDADRLDLSQAILQESRRMVDSSQTQDHREGVRAWVEKREPRFGLPE